MATFFLLIIYLAFISLGLPDSILGSAWPVMRPEFDAPLIRCGQILAALGALLLLLPLPEILSCSSLLLIGLGYAPIYPAMLHETPVRFGRANSQQLMGVQMALAYTGSTLMPSLLGAVAGLTSISIFPFFLAAAALGMLLCCERVNRLLAQGKMGGQ